jgi:hypothetical protein
MPWELDAAHRIHDAGAMRPSTATPYLWVEYISGFWRENLLRRPETSLRRETTDGHVRRTTLGGNTRVKCCATRTRARPMSANGVILSDRT